MQEQRLRSVLQLPMAAPGMHSHVDPDTEVTWTDRTLI
jgi:hypothetical protein